MGSSGGTSNPMYLSQGGVPMPGLPIAGQGAPNDRPQSFGQFQEFLPQIAPSGTPGYQILPASSGRNPSATGLTPDMFRYRSPQGATEPSSGGASASDVSSLRSQLAALQAQAGNGQFGAARGGSGGDRLMPMGMYGQLSSVAFPSNWINSNVPNATS